MDCKNARQQELQALKEKLVQHGYHGIAIQLINERLMELIK